MGGGGSLFQKYKRHAVGELWEVLFYYAAMLTFGCAVGPALAAILEAGSKVRWRGFSKPG